MKTKSNREFLTRVLAVPFALILLLLAGCLEKRIVWSSDGSRAAVITDDGLYISDADGELSAVLPNVYLASWLGDSQQLVIARKASAAKWAQIARAAGSERAKELTAEAEALWVKIQDSPPPVEGDRNEAYRVFFSMDSRAGAKNKLLGIYLKERYGDALKFRVGPDAWAEMEAWDVEIHEIVMARFDAGKMVPGTQLYEGLSEVVEIRPAPADRAIAFVLERKPAAQLFVARVNGSGSTLVAERVASFPDWTPDGRSVVYVQATGNGSSGVMELGALVRHEVLNAEFRISVADKKEELAGLAITELNRVRCLRDGRIIFNAAEIQLPVVNDDFADEHEQLFALDLARQPTLVRLIPRKRMDDLPQLLGFFEVSPNEKQILFGGIDSSVSLLTIATGEVAKIQGGDKDSNLRCAPTWRADDEFFYAKRLSEKDGKKPARPVEAVLRNGDKEKVLSTAWSDEMMHRLFGQKSFP